MQFLLKQEKLEDGMSALRSGNLELGLLLLKGRDYV